MQPRHCLALGILAAATLGRAGIARADPAAAEALFREGHQLLLDGRYQEAAAKLAESQSQDPASGTLINLALAYEKLGRLATAWATYQQAAILARRDGRADRVASAERKRAELEPRVPRLTLHAEAPGEDLSITWGNVRAGVGALDSAIPSDPGEYRIVAQAPGRATWEATVTLTEAERRTVTIPELGKVAVPSTTSPPAAPSIATTTEPPRNGAILQPSHVIVERRSPQPKDRTLAWVLGTSGLVSLGLGAAFGVRALNRYSEAKHLCPSHSGCSNDAIDAWHSAQTSAWVSNIGVGVGALACAASAWLFFGDSGNAHNVALSVAPLPSGAGFLVRSPL